HRTEGARRAGASEPRSRQLWRRRGQRSLGHPLMATIAEIRAQYPQYQDMSDKQLADALYSKHYSDMPRADFDRKVGLTVDAPADLKPGSKEYAQWAVAQVRAGKKLPAAPGSAHTEWSPATAQSRYDQGLNDLRQKY